jgi:hypothetical protein
VPNPKRASQFSQELTKDEKQLDKNLELAGWYQTVPYLRLQSQSKQNIATTRYLPAN